MVVIKEKIAEIRNCLEKIISRLIKEIEKNFETMEYHKPGKSGGHGAKFNVYAKEIEIRIKQGFFINRCYEGNEEQEIQLGILKTKVNRYRDNARGVNHK